MAKNLRTSTDYTIQAGTGAAGTNNIILDSKRVVVKGDLDVEGTNTVIDTTSLTIEDPILILSRNNSTPSDVDAGILVNRGAANNAAIYWNEGDDVFKAVTTTSDGTGNAIVDTALAKIQIAEPTAGSDAATKTYVDSTSGVSLSGSTNNQVTTVTGSAAIQGEPNLTFDGTVLAVTGNITATTSIANDAVSIVDNVVTATRSNDDLVLKASGTGNVVVNDTLTFSAMATDPTATAQTTLYNKTAGGGGTGLYFRNSNIGSGAVGELISKSKATALAIALG
jgi:lipopolysaccharide export system protein LptC